MPLKDQISADLKQAMLARDTLRVDTIKGLKSAILYEEVAQKVREEGLSDEQIQVVVAKECKKRDESAELFERGGNGESAAKERAEKEILSAYLPEQMNDDELVAIVDAVIAELQPEGMKDMGRVIGAVKSKVGNAADGAKIAALVKSKL